eukprot:8813088-Lingulodinium_polyedra.AAC.1
MTAPATGVGKPGRVGGKHTRPGTRASGNRRTPAPTPGSGCPRPPRRCRRRAQNGLPQITQHSGAGLLRRA